MVCYVLYYTVLKFSVIHYHHGTTRGSYVESISLEEDSNDHLVAKWWLEKCISMMMTLHNMYLVAGACCKISFLVLEQAMPNSKKSWSLSTRISSRMICEGKLKLDKTWNTRIIRAKTWKTRLQTWS